MPRTRSKPETSHSQFSPNSTACIKATHPIWAGECCTIVARPSPDAAIVELRSGAREYIALRYLQLACNHKFRPVWQTDDTLVERCDCGDRPPLPPIATVSDRLTEARNERPAAVLAASGDGQKQPLENVEHRIKCLLEQLQDSTCENSKTVEDNQQEPSETKTVEVLPAVMTEVEARQCIEAIKSYAIGLRKLLVELEDRRGWEVLGYASITACMVAEFDNSKPVLIRELKVGRIEEHYLQVPIGTYRESQLRPLSKLDLGEYKLAVEKAHQLAGNAKLTAVHVTKAVNELLSSARSAKTTAAPPYQVGELVRIACQPGALLEQKAWDGCWGIVKATGDICAVNVLVGNQEISFMASDLDWEQNSDPQFCDTCNRILALWQKAELEPVEENLLKFWQRRYFFTNLELRVISLLENS